jgi:LAO/AO transport system kinase
VPAHHGVDLRGVGHKPKQPLAHDDTWEIPVIQTVANTGQGIPEVATALSTHFDWLMRSGERKRRRRVRLAARIREEVERSVRHILWTERQGDALLEVVADSVERGETTPYDAARSLVATIVDGSATSQRGS